MKWPTVHAMRAEVCLVKVKDEGATYTIMYLENNDGTKTPKCFFADLCKSPFAETNYTYTLRSNRSDTTPVVMHPANTVNASLIEMTPEVCSGGTGSFSISPGGPGGFPAILAPGISTYMVTRVLYTNEAQVWTQGNYTDHFKFTMPGNGQLLLGYHASLLPCPSNGRLPLGSYRAP